MVGDGMSGDDVGGDGMRGGDIGLGRLVCRRNGWVCMWGCI